MESIQCSAEVLGPFSCFAESCGIKRFSAGWYQQQKNLPEHFHNLMLVFSVLPFNSNGPGEMGRAVVLSGDEEQKGKETFNINQFNLVVSDRVALNRSLPDVRMAQCRTKVYPPLESLPKVSVVIVFHNEAWSTLLRSIHSIINRSPLELIEEIILVDDKSDNKFDHLKGKLEQELGNFEVPLKLFRMPDRTGLIRARLKGAEEAKGACCDRFQTFCYWVNGCKKVPALKSVAQNNEFGS